MRYLWKPYLSYGQRRLLPKQSILYTQGDNGSGFYYVEEGKMNIRLLSDEGKERIIDYLLDGFLMGEQGISKQPYSTTAISETDAILYYFSNDAFNNICQKHPEAKTIFMNSLIKKIRMLVETVTMINRPYEQQMAYFLIRLYKKHASLSIPITQISLAQYIGTSRITVYKILQKWSESGLITLENRMIHILDLQKMKALYISEEKSDENVMYY